MAVEKFIRGMVDGHKHAGLRSTRRRLDAAFSQLTDWRNQRTAANEQGHQPELCFPGEIGGHFQLPPQIEEGGLVAPEVVVFKECVDTKVFDSPDRIDQIRADLLDAEIGGNYWSNGDKA